MACKSFYGEEYLLDSPLAVELYEKYAKNQPIFDYHCHLSPAEIANDRVFNNIGELWLECDHYKWRIMRACGVSEDLITGNSSWHDKFIAFAGSLEKAVGNPVYAFAHLELRKYFGITQPLNSKTAEDIWNKANEKMADGSFSAKKLIMGSNVEALCTTDDPADNLEFHKEIAKDKNFTVKVLPTFRPDMLCTGLVKDNFADYIKRLGAADNSFEALEKAFCDRLDAFCRAGCVISDISLADIPSSCGCRNGAKKAYEAVMNGETATDEMSDKYMAYMLRFAAKEYAKRGMVMQLHFSAIRNNNQKRFKAIGADCGIDSVGRCISIEAFGSFLNDLETEGLLPKTIVYTLNRAQYYELATMIGNFWGEIPGKLQMGSAWWFCDHLGGIKEQLELSCETGVLGYFNGMLTDSRSFTSYARHDFFRRILCNYMAEFMLGGQYDSDVEIMGGIVADISINNIRKFALK